MTKFLLSKEANIKDMDNADRCVLNHASADGEPLLVKLLLDKGASMEQVDKNGVRPLDKAVSCSNIHVVKCFLRQGAKLGPSTWRLASGKTFIM